MKLKILIDHKMVEVEQGITILQAARENQIDIPTLCDYPGLPSPGSCRMCVVEIQGRPNMPTACTTPVEEGMEIHTQSAKVRALRVELLQMLLSEHPSGCLFCPEKANCDECMVTLRKAAVTTGCSSCPKNSQCELQRLAEEYEVEKSSYPMRYRMVPVEKNDPFFDRDYNLCILCGRCIRVCEDLHFTSTLAFTKRGTHTLVGTSFHRSHLDSNCTFCGECVEICPTGALSEKTRKWDGHPEGETASTCPLCSIGCQINLLTKKDRVLGSLPNRSANEEALCVKGRFGITELVNHPTRLKHPQKRIEETWLGVSWEEAIKTAAEKLAACSPERFELQISISCTTEDLYVAAKFARVVMKGASIRFPALNRYENGINPVIRMLQQSRPLDTIQKASSVLCIGFEDKYAQSNVEVHLRRAHERGVKIIAFGDQPLPWSGHADEWLQAEPGQYGVMLQRLVELTTLDSETGEVSFAVERAAQILRQSQPAVVLLGPAVLTKPDVLQAVETLIQNLNMQVIMLPEETNLAGADWLDLLTMEFARVDKELDVLYLIGEKVPDNPFGQPFTLYQNFYPPSGASTVDLMLPTTAFIEEEGSYLDYARQVKAIHAAVKPSGQSLPNWLILSRIAQAMGSLDFEYSSVGDIQAEIPGFTKAIVQGSPIVWNPHRSVHHDFPDQQGSVMPNAHSYMGYPLTQWVEGLRELYSKPATEREA